MGGVNAKKAGKNGPCERGVGESIPKGHETNQSTWEGVNAKGNEKSAPVEGVNAIRPRANQPPCGKSMPKGHGKIAQRESMPKGNEEISPCGGS